MTAAPKRKLTTLKPRLQVMGSRLQSVQGGTWRAGKTSTERGYGYKWQKAREAYLKERPFCVYCLRAAVIPASTMLEEMQGCISKGIAFPYAQVVDHKTPHRGDERLFWDRENWQGLCFKHHNQDKQREESRGG